MIETIHLPGSLRPTTRLGFGGSGLLGGMSERDSLRLLEIAFDCGIRHFDVAPSYGHGQAERCLGKFLRGKSQPITVATKYGILPPPHAGWLGRARSIARPLARAFPAFRRSIAEAAAGLRSRARFSAEELRASFERSLNDLGLERIDLFLLHEVTAADLEDSGLLVLLDQMRRRGRLGAYGAASERGQLDLLLRKEPELCRVLQYEWSPFEMRHALDGAFTIRHRVLQGGVAAIRQLFDQEPALCRAWSSALDCNLADAESLAGLLLGAALAAYPEGMVLFSSRSSAHIRSSVRLATDRFTVPRARRFLELIRDSSRTTGPAT